MCTLRLLTVMCLCALVATLVAEEIDVAADGQTTLPLGSSVTVELALSQGYLLGLAGVDIDGVPVRPDGWLQRPLVASEWGDERVLGMALRLDRVERLDDGGLALHATLRGSGELDAYREFYLMTARRGDAEAGTAPEVEALRSDALAAQAAVAERLAAIPEVVEAEAAVAAAQAAVDANERGAGRKLKRAERTLTSVRRSAHAALLDDPAQAELAETLATWRTTLQTVALRDHARIHRDYYRFPLLRQPAEVATIATQTDLVARWDQRMQDLGQVVWTLSPVTEVVAGWPWQGWEQSVAVNLADGHELSVIYHLGGWAVGGSVGDAVPVALRYRGLGGIEQPLAESGADVVATSFTTTEVLPGAVGGAPLVSPVVGSGAAVTDRGYGLRHRVGAWICRMARGAGAPFVDYQYQRTASGEVPAILAAYPVRQSDLRAVTEAFPGDQVIGQIDDQRFARTASATSVPFRYLALVPEQPFPRHEQLTRWQELDQHVRDLVAAELDFVQYEPVPAVHLLHDHAHGPRIATSARSIPGLAAEGVKRVEVHGPGWINGRNQGKDGPPKVGGGDCSVYDYVPMTDAQQPWIDLQDAMVEHDVEYHIWITGMVWGTAGFASDVVGLESERWSWNSPEDAVTKTPSGYGGHLNLNIRDEVNRTAFLERIDMVAEEYGMQGFWADSFQNLFMSTLDWAAGDGAPLQRLWWEQLAEWSREGFAWTAESHAFPGMSCSIEVDNRFEDAWWFLQHVSRAYRADSWPEPGTPYADRLFFRIMANKGQAIPYLNPGRMPSTVVPSFQRMAQAYMTALPSMRRSWVLPDASGTLWSDYSNNQTGIWFPFADAQVPDGVTATPIAGGDAVTAVSAQYVYVVAADDLPAAFGMRSAPLQDDRLGRSYVAPEMNRPARHRSHGGN